MRKIWTEKRRSDPPGPHTLSRNLRNISWHSYRRASSDQVTDQHRRSMSASFIIHGLQNPVHVSTILCSDESFFWGDFEHAVHLQPSSCQLLSTGTVDPLRLTLLPRCQYHKSQADGHNQSAEQQERDDHHQPGDPVPVALFLHTHTPQLYPE